MNEATIVRTTIPVAEREHHVDRLFGAYFPLQFEAFVFRQASELSSDYTGGRWEFYELSNGGFYMAPESDEPFHVACPNGYRGVLEADTLGVIVCTYALSHLSFIATKPIARTYATLYHLLRDYAIERRDIEAILGATD